MSSSSLPFQYVASSQAELDYAINDFGASDLHQILIDAPSELPLTLTEYCQASIVAAGHTTFQYVAGDARIDTLRDFAVIEELRDTAQVTRMRGRSVVRRATGDSRIQNMHQESLVESARGSAFIQDMYDDAAIDTLSGAATVGDLYDRARVTRATGASVIQRLNDHAFVSRVADQACVLHAGGYSVIISLRGRALVRAMSGRASVWELLDDSRVSRIGTWARVGIMRDESSVGALNWNAGVGFARDNSRVIHMAGSSRLTCHTALSTVQISGSASIDRAAGSTTVLKNTGDPALQRVGTVQRAVNLADIRDTSSWIAKVAPYVSGGRIRLYKAVDRNGLAGRDYTPTQYTVGEQVECGDWRDDFDCGGGLHLSPSPMEALTYSYEQDPRDTRFMECECELSDIRVLSLDKVKVPRLKVIREVDFFGDPVSEEEKR